MKKPTLYVFLFLAFFNMALTQSSLPECKGNDIKNPLKKFLKTKKWSNCHGTFLDLKGKPAYVGEFYKGQPHGQGIFTHAGRKYVGQYKNHKSENYLGMVQTIWLTNQEFIDFYHGKIKIESAKKGSLETYKELVSLWK